MRFNSAAFNRHLNHMGQAVAWQRRYACPCVNKNSGQADPRHALCSGKGHLWDDPIDTVVGVASQKVQAEWIAAGLYATGDMVLSVQASSVVWDAGPYDKITMKNSTTAFSQALTRGTPSEKLSYLPLRLTRCFWLTGADRSQIVDGGLPVFSASGVMSWPNGGEPPAGTAYTLSGERNDVYYVFDQLPSNRNEHQGVKLPKRLIGRSIDLLSR